MPSFARMFTSLVFICSTSTGASCKNEILASSQVGMIRTHHIRVIVHLVIVTTLFMRSGCFCMLIVSTTQQLNTWQHHHPTSMLQRIYLHICQRREHNIYLAQRINEDLSLRWRRIDLQLKQVLRRRWLQIFASSSSVVEAAGVVWDALLLWVRCRLGHPLARRSLICVFKPPIVWCDYAAWASAMIGARRIIIEREVSNDWDAWMCLDVWVTILF